MTSHKGFIFYVHWCYAYMYVCVRMLEPGVKDSCELSCHMVAENQTQVLWKSSQCSKLLSQLFSPIRMFQRHLNCRFRDITNQFSLASRFMNLTFVNS